MNAADELRQELDRQGRFLNGVTGHGRWYDRKPYSLPNDVAKALRRPTDWQFIRALSRESGIRIGATWAHTPEQKARWRAEDKRAHNQGIDEKGHGEQ